jgi:hypothetical protein
MILINLLYLNENIMGVNLHETKIKTFSHNSIKCHYSIKFLKNLKLKTFPYPLSLSLSHTHIYKIRVLT